MDFLNQIPNGLVDGLVWQGLITVAAILGVIFFGRKISLIEKSILLWYIYDLLTHVFIEGSFVYFSLVSTAAKYEAKNAFDGSFQKIWIEYGKADTRWAHADPTIVSLELLTVFLDSLFCVLIIREFINGKHTSHARHYWQVVLAVCELYGGWMTFVPEMLIGNPALNTADPLYFWFYLVFFNGLWVVIPLALMYQSWKFFTEQKLKIKVP